MKTVAVLGGGPAGAFAAERLARAGLKAIVFDEKLAWEKPCGGGLTYKAYHEYPFLMDNPWPKKLVHETVIGAPKSGEAQDGSGSPAGDLFAFRSERDAAGTRRARRRRHREDARARNRAARPRLAVAHQAWGRGGRFLHRGDRRPQPPARRRHAVERRRTP